MGLSGRKTKQRIPNDPRNLNWANDANKFGAAYLAKFGWDSSQGLGVDGDGRKQAISVTQKLDMLGIGADHRNSQEGLAWKQNKDFENLLKRLNAANGTVQEEEEVAMKVDGFVRAGPGAGAGTMQDTEEAEEGSSSDGDEKKSKKKRKKEAREDDGGERKRKRRKGKSSGDHSDAEEESKKDKKKKKKQESSGESTPAPTSQSRAAVVPAVHPAAAPTKSKAPRPHRARHMASKNLASKSASAIAEILGIAPDPSTAPSAAASGSATPYSGFSSTPFPSTPYEPGPSTSASPTPAPGPTKEELKLQELTVSSKSVMDYFKEKLAAKSNAASGAATPASPVTPREEELDDYADRPRIGLGASRLRVETTVEEAQEVRGGLGGIGSGSRMQFAAMFAKASTTATVTTEVVAVQSAEEVETAQVDAPETRKEKKSKKDKKDKKGKAKAGAEDEDAADAALEAADGDEKAERKRRKEEKRRRKEAEALAAPVLEPADADEKQERKRKKDKRKSKGDS
ncbi:uncharacterized protein TRAVEDRAFT_50368 [Trametes versicolor FP-101664 SS1]|uniref:uncharacterized protein n=1 Tax=Trametes versicolor (strain FP-101664) TaxID=717944 RepID=UPI00046246F1|nr:uncharacterized protein TRAVEDRAFT_50368 [Trametes versicolor FP-101664 SS1]EIW55881.1 hypothetical protein TRAVEDRAFT_50368 [Trametes versicolor FP-101664 SS1]